MGQAEGCFVSRNHSMHDSVSYLRNNLPHETDILHEYFIPQQEFVAFVDGLRQIGDSAAFEELEGAEANGVAVQKPVIHARGRKSAETEKPEWSESAVTGTTSGNGFRVAFADPELRAGRLLELAQFLRELLAVDDFGLEALDELESADQAQALGLDVGRAWSSTVLRVEATDPGLVELGGLAQEPLCRERLRISGLHE